MKIGSAYSVRDSFGSQYIIEKVADGIVLHNPGSEPTKIDLNSLNFTPILEKPEQYRYEAAKIVASINQVMDDYRSAQVRAKGRFYGGNWSVPPNRLKLSEDVVFINADGTLASSDQASVRNLYSSNRAFRLAVDSTTLADLEKDNQFSAFQRKCSFSAVRERHGSHLEYATYTCRDSKNLINYSRTYVVGNGFVAQGWDSILKDKSYTDAMKSASRSARVAEAIAGIVPILGNVDAAAKCGGGKSLVYRLANASLAPKLHSDVRKFVSYSEEQETPSSVGKALDCAQGIAAVGNVRAALTGGANLLKLNNMLASPQYKKATEALALFDTKLYTKERTLSLIDKAKEFSSPTAAFMSKVFYDQAQNVNTRVRQIFW